MRRLRAMLAVGILLAGLAFVAAPAVALAAPAESAAGQSACTVHVEEWGPYGDNCKDEFHAQVTYYTVYLSCSNDVYLWEGHRTTKCVPPAFCGGYASTIDCDTTGVPEPTIPYWVLLNDLRHVRSADEVGDALPEEELTNANNAS